MLTVAPLVEVVSEVVYTGPGQSPVIECVVESDPKAIVLWYHNRSTTAIDFTRTNIDTGQTFITVLTLIGFCIFTRFCRIVIIIDDK